MQLTASIKVPKKPMSHQSKQHQSKPYPSYNPSDPHARQPDPAQNRADHSHSTLSKGSLPDSRRLGSYLLEAGLINSAQIEVVLNDQQMMEEMRFGEVLVARGWIKAETIDFVMRRVVEPERASRAYPEQPVIPEPQIVAPPEVSPPPFPTSPPQSRVMARARSLDGEVEFDILLNPIVDEGLTDGRSQGLLPTTPLTRSTDSGRNDRKSLPSVPDEDGVNWAG